MNFLKTMALLLLFCVLTWFGLCSADNGSKKVAGYLDENTMFDVVKTDNKFYITVLNSTFTIG